LEPKAGGVGGDHHAAGRERLAGAPSLKLPMMQGCPLLPARHH